MTVADYGAQRSRLREMEDVLRSFFDAVPGHYARMFEGELVLMARTPHDDDCWEQVGNLTRLAGELERALA